MIYLTYQAQSDVMAPLRLFAQAMVTTLDAPWGAFTENAFLRSMSAAYEMVARAGLTHERPPYAVSTTVVGDETVPVREEIALATPFADLLHFAKDVAAPQPRVLVVAPLSGHFATLLRSTIATMLADHDVYVTDWRNARDVDPFEGVFGFDEYVEHIIRFLDHIGPGAHVLAVCQPCVQTLAAAAVMAERDHPAQPRSMTLMGGPVDTRINPTKVNELATSRPLDWFEKNLIARVPWRYAGAGRRVYPGFVQLSAFMAMNMDRHVRKHLDLFELLARGEKEEAKATKGFYDEYFAVLDLPAEFYLETVSQVFQKHELPRGELRWRGCRVKPEAIRKTTLLTVEGERDDICAIGQTLAAHDLCSGLRPYRKRHHLQPGVGHYGLFSGRKWETQIYPIVRNAILASE